MLNPERKGPSLNTSESGSGDANDCTVDCRLLLHFVRRGHGCRRGTARNREARLSPGHRSIADEVLRRLSQRRGPGRRVLSGELRLPDAGTRTGTGGPAGGSRWKPPDPGPHRSGTGDAPRRGTGPLGRRDRTAQAVDRTGSSRTGGGRAGPADDPRPRNHPPDREDAHHRPRSLSRRQDVRRRPVRRGHAVAPRPNSQRPTADGRGPTANSQQPAQSPG
jgi:hypothetical protein